MTLSEKRARKAAERALKALRDHRASCSTCARPQGVTHLCHRGYILTSDLFLAHGIATAERRFARRSR